ncbi:methyltransferase domain-containing protein, putative [Eimeria acervulina]|uniref:Methyltransferase domain-containing protein, putative n=1 Tax=Eimeria acervulina TaxID=5801 RepID=U6GN58_EIMAC|nr:methyltransferase domain-containing protein, putative [Eimeria acervulina]CDI81610.1 methyltransferase domain-containing protein, putative [Eimeria acervulina]
MDLFFVDYDMLPLLIQENYLTGISQGLQQRSTLSSSKETPVGCRGTPSAELESLICCSKAAAALSRADTANSVLRSSQDWSLLSVIGAFCCLNVPAEIVAPLARGGDPQETVDRLAAYGLRREHLLEHMQSLMLKKQTRLYDLVESRSKAAFTRLCSSIQQQLCIQPKRTRSGPQSLKEVIEREEGDVSGEETDEEETEGDSAAAAAAAKRDNSAANKKAGSRAAAKTVQTKARGRGGGVRKERKVKNA